MRFRATRPCGVAVESVTCVPLDASDVTRRTIVDGVVDHVPEGDSDTVCTRAPSSTSYRDAVSTAVPVLRTTTEPSSPDVAAKNRCRVRWVSAKE